MLTPRRLLVVGVLAIWYWSWARETLAGSVHVGMLAIESSAIVWLVAVASIAAGLWRGRSAFMREPRALLSVVVLIVTTTALSFIAAAPLAALDTRIAFFTLRPRMEKLARMAPRGVSSRECIARFGEPRVPGDSACMTDASAQYLGVAPAADDSSHQATAYAAAAGFFDTEVRLSHVAFVRTTGAVGTSSGFVMLRENAPATPPARLFGFPVTEWEKLKGRWYHFRTAK